ncbi:MAG: hypothetical protein FJ290_02815 [Planctomycetes bacterium]|nr:hypothetical protein [Planctomycetota bacterium]
MSTYGALGEAEERIEPGVYRVSFGAFSLKECWRVAGPWLFPIMLVCKLLSAKGPYVWLPASQAIQRCAAEELSAEALAHLMPAAEELRLLGFSAGAFSRMVKVLDSTTKESAAYMSLHDDGTRLAEAVYVRSVARQGSREVEKRTIALTTLFLTEDMEAVVVTNSKQAFVSTECVAALHVMAGGPRELCSRLDEALARYGGHAKRIGTLAEAQQASERFEDARFLRLIRHGVYQKVGEEEARSVLDAAEQRAAGRC